MIPAPYNSAVFESEKNAGFRKTKHWVCKAGPHELFETLGEVQVFYSLGKKKWVLSQAISWRSTGPKTKDVFYTNVGFFGSFALACEAADTLITVLYASVSEADKAIDAKEAAT